LKRHQLGFNSIFLSGGSGKRLWPLSTHDYPKQFLKFRGKKNLFQNTIQRLLKIQNKTFRNFEQLILTNEKFRFNVRNSLAEFFQHEDCKILLEPQSKNTLNAIAFATFYLTSLNNDEPMVIVPIDHNFSDEKEFVRVIKKLIKNCHKKNNVNVIGIKLKEPNSNYGYIETEFDSSLNMHNVLNFHEKPSLNDINKYFSSDNFFCNSGIFVLRPSKMLELLKIYQFSLYKNYLKAFESFSKDNNFIRINEKYFNKLNPISIDYGIMEIMDHEFHMSNLEIYDAVWLDYGSWPSLKTELKKDHSNNYHFQKVIASNSRNNIIYNPKKNIFIQNISDSLIVESSNNILVAKDFSNSDLSLFYDKDKGYLENNTSHRPWGWFTTILEESGFKVKKITILPNSSISLQKHLHRSEHWVVVSGEATVLCGTKKLILKTNESIFIKKNRKHKITNHKKINLEIIEVQTGKYLDESDIIRYEDEYGRK
jgi:mannose-1-phosphate guanylyltransferase/mannose-6-phosphate isomerase